MDVFRNVCPGYNKKHYKTVHELTTCFNDVLTQSDVLKTWISQLMVDHEIKKKERFDDILKVFTKMSSCSALEIVMKHFVTEHKISYLLTTFQKYVPDSLRQQSNVGPVMATGASCSLAMA